MNIVYTSNRKVGYANISIYRSEYLTYKNTYIGSIGLTLYRRSLDYLELRSCKSEHLLTIF